MSQHTLESTTIGEHTYEMGMLAPRLSNSLLMAVARMVGPAVGPLLDATTKSQESKGKSVLDMELGGDFFSKAIGALFEHLDEKTFDRVVNEFAKVTIVVGKGELPKVFDAHFMGALDELYKWLAWGMKVQWGKSFSALANVTRGLGQGASKKESPSPTT